MLSFISNPGLPAFLLFCSQLPSHFQEEPVGWSCAVYVCHICARLSFRAVLLRNFALCGLILTFISAAMILELMLLVFALIISLTLAGISFKTLFRLPLTIPCRSVLVYKCQVLGLYWDMMIALFALTVMAIFLGRHLSQRIDRKAITRAAGVVFLLIGLSFLFSAVAPCAFAV